MNIGQLVGLIQANGYTHAGSADYDNLWSDGLIVPCGDACSDLYEITPKGRVFLRMLLDTPYPVQVWTDPR